jgi:RNase P subunit RPR2
MVAKRDRLSKRKGVVPQSRREKRTMQPEDLQKRWEEQGEDIFAAVAQWRAAHPKATLAEIEQAVDEHMNRLRARMIEQAAQASGAADHDGSQELVCEQCGQPLQARGRAKRRWQTHGGQEVEVERTYVTCPQCGGGFFPPGPGTAGA